MQITLLPYEGRTLKALAAKLSLERELTVGIAEDLHLLARLFERVVSWPEPEFNAGRVVIMGLINHVQIPTEGGHLFRFERGQGSDLKPATIPI